MTDGGFSPDAIQALLAVLNVPSSRALGRHIIDPHALGLYTRRPQGLFVPGTHAICACKYEVPVRSKNTERFQKFESGLSS